MRVLVVSQHFWPESFRINDVVVDLTRVGCEVEVLTGQPNYPEGSVFPGYKALSMGRQAYGPGITVHRVPLAARGPGSAVRLAANYLSFIFSASILGPWLLRGRRFDAVFVYGTSPILQAIPAVLFKLRKRARLVIWVQDLWPESLEVTGFVRNKRLLGAVAAVVRWIYRRADLLLVQSEAFIPPVSAMAGGTRVVYHPNPGEAMQEHGAAGEAAPRVPLDEGAFNVVFAGNLGTVQALETVVEAADRLREHADIRIVLVGGGSRAEWVQQEVSRRGLTNVQLPGKFPSASMPDLMRRASALLVTLSRQPILAQTVPSKLQTYLAGGTPIIASLDGEGARVVVEAGAGLACPAEDAGALATAVLRLRDMPAEERARLGAAGRQFFARHYEPLALAERLAAWMRTVPSRG